MAKLKRYLQSQPYGQLTVFLFIVMIGLYLSYLFIAHLPLLLSGACRFISRILSAFSPLFIGLAIAYILSPLVRRAEKKLPRTLAILLTFTGILLGVFLLFYSLTLLILGKMAFYSPQELLENLFDYFAQYEATISSLLEKLPSTLLSNGLEDTLNHFLGRFASQLNAGAAMDFVKSIGSGIVNFVLGVVVSFYLLKDRDFFLRLWRKLLHLLLPLKQSARFKGILAEIDMVVSRFLRGQLLDGLIVAVLSSVGLSLIGLQFAVFVGIFAGICNIIPYFGPILGMIPAAIIGISTGGLSKALFSILVLFLIQQTDSTVISPKVVGTSTGLHPVFVLLSVAAGGYFFGIAGMLLAVPVTAILKLFIVKALDRLE